MTARNSETLERLRRVTEESGLQTSVALALDEFAAPDIEFSSVLARSVEGESVFRGVDEVREYMRGFFELLGDLNLVDVDVSATSADVAVISARVVGVAKGSAIPLDQPVALVYEFRDGQIERITSFLSQDEAVETARELAGV